MPRRVPEKAQECGLIGRTVDNEQGETLGDINNVILNEIGDVVAVTIGVGGFLGIGEKNVGVPFEVLEFRTDEARADNSDVRRSESSEKQEQVAKDRDARFDSEHSDMRIVLDATESYWMRPNSSSNRPPNSSGSTTSTPTADATKGSCGNR